MQVVKIVVWEEDKAWFGYLHDYPDYWTQGETEQDLKDLHHDVTSGTIPGIRRLEELVVS
ncbi:MAG TPA: type II toxin-antitoxin system HicB family antitoxin [Gemmataceae bacterium]|nr:type II toxin-antitoxin system HicB family antitoxin [Gemmataceae bacterium]